MRAAAEGALHGGGLPAYAFTRRRGSILGANGTGSKRGAGTNLHEAYAWLYDEQRPPPMARRRGQTAARNPSTRRWRRRGLGHGVIFYPLVKL